MELDLTEPLNLLRRHEGEVRHFVALLATANTRARLTGPTDELVLWEDHVVDCAAALALLPQGGQVIDVGTGGGLPGLVWALCRPDVAVTLLDSVERKCALVGEMVQVLGLPPERVQVVCERSETFAARNREVFDLASARAVCEAGVLAEVLSPWCVRGDTCWPSRAQGQRRNWGEAGGSGIAWAWGNRSGWVTT